MPVIVQSQEPHPFLPTLGSASAIEAQRALRQDIRPLKIAILNLMADKLTTERQLAHWLGATPLQIDLSFLCTDSYFHKIENGHQPAHTSAEHTRAFYTPWSRLRDQKFDGLIITGTNALKDRVEDEDNWREVTEILEWTKTHVFSSIFLCWGAKAALKHFHDINSHKQKQKILGLFDHKVEKDSVGLLFGFPDKFSMPVGRWKNPDAEAIYAAKDLEVVASSKGIGPNIIVEASFYDDGKRSYPRRIYILSHPEYETDTLDKEFKRDRSILPSVPLPHNYYTGDDPDTQPVNSWRHTGSLYTNWLGLTYAAAPSNLADIPLPYTR